MTTSNNNENKGFITQSDLKNFIFIGGVVLAGVIYVLNMQTEIQILKTKIENMEQMIKDIHDQQIGSKSKISALPYSNKNDNKSFDLVGMLHDIESDILNDIVSTGNLDIDNITLNETGSKESNEQESEGSVVEDVVLYHDRKRYIGGMLVEEG